MALFEGVDLGLGGESGLWDNIFSKDEVAQSGAAVGVAEVNANAALEASKVRAATTTTIALIVGGLVTVGLFIVGIKYLLKS